MKTYFLLGLGVLLAGSSIAAAQNAVPGFPDVKVVPVDKTAVTTPQAGNQASGQDIQQRLSAHLSQAGYTNVKIVPEAFIVAATNKAGEQVTMFLSPDSMTVFTAIDAKGQDSRIAPVKPDVAPKS